MNWIVLALSFLAGADKPASDGLDFAPAAQGGPARPSSEQEALAMLPPELREPVRKYGQCLADETNAHLRARPADADGASDKEDNGATWTACASVREKAIAEARVAFSASGVAPDAAERVIQEIFVGMDRMLGVDANGTATGSEFTTLQRLMSAVHFEASYSLPDELYPVFASYSDCKLLSSGAELTAGNQVVRAVPGDDGDCSAELAEARREAPQVLRDAGLSAPELQTELIDHIVTTIDQVAAANLLARNSGGGAR